MSKVRPPAVAGMFYPDQPQHLRQVIQDYLASATNDSPPPKAIVVPHAGYIYSGSIAASAYKPFQALPTKICRVVMIGPAHRFPIQGLATSSAESFLTPLGKVKLDREAMKKINKLPQVFQNDLAHAQEHSLEVQLPFLQSILQSFSFIPLVAGEITQEEVSEVLELLWGNEETLIVISSDLSHYHDYDTAKAIDDHTSQAILRLQPNQIDYEHACGRNGIQGLLQVARQKGLAGKLYDLRNSGDTAGDKNRVVGYGAYGFDYV